MNMQRTGHAVPMIAGAFALSLFATSASAQVDLTKSTVIATAKQLGVPIEGKFKKIAATIQFNQAQLAQANAKIEIEVGSYDMGSPEYNKEVVGKDWFAAAQFPKATFVSSSVVAAGAGKFNVTGKLTLKGKTVDLTIPVSVKQEGVNQIFDGAIPIKRTQFNIGDGEWKDTSVVADEVVIRFHVVAMPLK